MNHNACILRREEFKEVKFPAKVYGYLALCQDLKQKHQETLKNDILPFVSDLTQKSTPEGVRHAYWSFLKY